MGKTRKTKKVNSIISHEYNEKFEWDLDYETADDIDPLEINAYDRGWVKDTSFGEKTVDLSEIFQNPSKPNFSNSD